jgi:hypothetical protein
VIKVNQKTLCNQTTPANCIFSGKTASASACGLARFI